MRTEANMNKLHRLAPAILGLGMALIISIAAFSCLSPNENTIAVIPRQKSLEFELGSLTLTPKAIMVDESATVNVTVTNGEDEAGSYTAVLSIEGEEYSKQDILLEPGTSKDVNFEVQVTNAGSYELSVGTSSAVLTVYEWSPNTIQYDSGTSLGAYYITGELGHIVHFTPQTKPFELQKLTIYGTVLIENPKDLDTRQFTVRVWNSDKSELLWTNDFPWRLFEGPMGWKEVEIPNLRLNDDFHVELVTHSEQLQMIANEEVANYISINWDRPVLQNGQPVSVLETRSGWSQMGSLVKAPQGISEAINWFIRAEGAGAPLVLSYDDGVDEEWNWTTASHYVVFSPVSAPFEVQTITIYGYIRAKDITNLKSKQFTVSIRDQTSKDILWEQDLLWDVFAPEEAKWVILKTPGITCPGDFYVRLISNSDDEDNCLAIGVDTSNPNKHSYIAQDLLSSPGKSTQIKGAEYDKENSNWMIRVEGIYQ
jgi:hypothetical protein